MNFMESIQGAITEAAQQTDMNEAQTGGGERRIPEAGLARLRFISYIEMGTHHDEKYDKDKTEVVLQFELSGPKHEPFDINGKKVPHIITIRENLSLNEKANFYKLFKRMNHTGEYTHMAQMLGKEFLGTVVNVTKGEGNDKRTYSNLRDDGGYTIRPPFHEDLEGNSVKVEVQPALTPLKCFLFDYATKDMWDSIFIDGRWDDKTDDNGKVIKEGRSKNIWQEQIKKAKNWPGSAMAELLLGDGADLPWSEGAEKPERSETPEEPKKETSTGAPADPLEGMVPA